MRFTIIPESGDEVILNDTLNNQSIGWYLVDSIVEGWYGTPAPREDALEAVGRTGDEFPSRLTQGARIVTIYGCIDCPSSISATRMIHTINNLFGQHLEIIGEDAEGEKRAFGYLSDDPQPKFLPGEKMVKFSLVIKCPYPIKLGRELSYKAANGGCQVFNEGNAPSFPRVEVKGRITSLELYFDGHTVKWSGSTSGLSIDFFNDLEVSSGDLVSDDAFSIPNGEHYINVRATPSNANVTIFLASAWR